MAVPVIIDGYNLLYARGEEPSAPARARLVRDLVVWARARGRRAVVVFDAWAGGARAARQEERGPVTVCFTRYGERADEHIVRLVAGRPEAVVVTGDRAVQQAVRRRGAAVLDAATFAGRLDAVAPAAAPPEPDDGRDESDGDDARSARAPRGGRRQAWLRGL